MLGLLVVPHSGFTAVNPTDSGCGTLRVAFLGAAAIGLEVKHCFGPTSKEAAAIPTMTAAAKVHADGAGMKTAP